MTLQPATVGTKAAAESWLAAVGTDREAEETKNYVAELEEDIMPIDTLSRLCRIRRRSAGFGADAAGGSPRKRNQVCGSKFATAQPCNVVAEILEKRNCFSNKSHNNFIISFIN